MRLAGRGEELRHLTTLPYVYKSSGSQKEATEQLQTDVQLVLQGRQKPQHQNCPVLLWALGLGSWGLNLPHSSWTFLPASLQAHSLHLPS